MAVVVIEKRRPRPFEMPPMDPRGSRRLKRGPARKLAISRRLGGLLHEYERVA